MSIAIDYREGDPGNPGVNATVDATPAIIWSHGTSGGSLLDGQSITVEADIRIHNSDGAGNLLYVAHLKQIGTFRLSGTNYVQVGAIEDLYTAVDTPLTGVDAYWVGSSGGMSIYGVGLAATLLWWQVWVKTKMFQGAA